MKQEVQTAEEVSAIVDSLMAENKWAISVLELKTGSFIIQWMEHKTYTSHSGKVIRDEVWTTKEGEMKLIQDLEPEHARNIIRNMIREEREAKQDLRSMFDQLIEAISDEDDEDEESFFPEVSKKTLH